MLRAPTALATALSFLLNIGCAAYAPTPRPVASGLPSRGDVSLTSATPFDFVGRTPLDVTLRCPAVFLNGRLSMSQGDTLFFANIFEHEYVPGSEPGCWEMKRGIVVQSATTPFTITVAAEPRSRELHRYIVPAVVLIGAIVLVLNWRSIGSGSEVIF